MFPPPRFLLGSRWSERWVSSIWRAVAHAVLPQYSVQRRFGRLMLCNMGEPVGRAMICKGLWEHRQFELLEREIPRRRQNQRMIFLDVGAYWGLYSLYFQAAGGFDEIHAFEPSPRNQVLLDLHLQMNGLEGAVEVHRVAVSDAPGEIPAEDFHAAARLTGADPAIPAVAIDDVLAHEDCFLVIKIDVDGFEGQALAGMAGLLARNRVLMQIEILPEARDEVFAQLQALGLEQIGFVAPDDYFFAK